jgi:Asp-tRNA(Asn)/Glu-tRNA(Gln) amidotransferase A subunit family amidase
VTPAAYCGVVGYKPTYQRMPLDGVIPFAPSMDHGGLITTDVATARVAAAVVCDDWKRDSSAPGTVLGVPAVDYLHRAEAPAIEAFDTVIEGLRREGFVIIETSSLANIEAIAVAHRRLIAAEFSRVHTDWFSTHSDRYRRRSAGLYREGADLPESAITEGRESGKKLLQSLEATMQQEGIVAWVSPSATGVAPLGLDYIGDPIMGVPWTHAHVPVVTLPARPSFDGLPLGIQLAGRIGGDEELLALASLVEVALVPTRI